MECTAENLERVVTLFYRSEAGQQAQAHQWLTEAQNSPHAWSFVWELLQPHRSSEVQFFAATTLHTKLLKHWNEVPTEHYEHLKKKIVENIINYAMGPKIVLNRLCIALSAYIIHTIPNHWPNAFEELVSSFQPQNLPNINSDRVTWILLEILTVIPEEFQSTTLPSSQRTRVRVVLQEVSHSILRVLEAYLETSDNEAVEADTWSSGQLTTWLVAARCGAAWLGGIGGGGALTDSAGVAQALVRLVCRVYWARVSEDDADSLSGDELELVEAASEALGALLAHPAAHKQPVAVAERLQDVVPPLALISTAELVKPSRAQNRDVLCCIAGLLVGVADTHSKLLVEWLAGDNGIRQDLALQVIRAVLALSGAPGRYPVDESASALTWGVWYTLQDDAFALGADAALVQLKPLYRELALALLRKAAFPGEDYDRYSSDEQELFRCYRQDVADTLLYCGAVLGPDLGALLGTRLTAALDSGPQAWPAIEAALLAHQAVAEEALVPRLMQVLNEIPYATLPSRVLSTALDTCGAHAEWLEGDPLSYAVQLLCAGLAQPAVTASASLALKDVAHAAQRALAPHASCLLAACQTALETPQLRLAEATRLMFSVGKLLGALPPYQHSVMDYLNVILAPHFTELQLLLNQTANNTVVTNIVTRLKMVSALFMALQGEGPDGGALLVVAATTMPLYEALGARWSTHGAVLDALCTLLRHVVTGLGEAGASLAPALLALLGQAYRSALHPAPLHVARLLLLLWGTAAAPLLVELAAVSLALDPTASQHLDALEAWWTTLAQLTKKAPRLLVGAGVDPSLLLSRASMCLSRPELPLLKASASFLAAFVLQARELGLQEVILAEGEALVIRVLASLAGAAPRSAAEPLADVLLALNKRFCDSLARWLAVGLALCPTCPPAYRDGFARAVLRERANKRRLTEAVLEFTLICRGILRPEQQQQQQQ